MNSLKKAQKLIASNFRIYGIGNFDLTAEEHAEIIEFLETEDFKSLNKLYEQLERQRLG